jgi:hypothetical protein
MKATIWHNPRCSKSRQALDLLREGGSSPARPLSSHAASAGVAGMTKKALSCTPRLRHPRRRPGSSWGTSVTG